jgi:hypothetical protein
MSDETQTRPAPAPDSQPDGNLTTPPLQDPNDPALLEQTPPASEPAYSAPAPVAPTNEAPKAVIIPPPAPEPVEELVVEDDQDKVGQWECLAEPKDCSLAAPDARTPGKPFDGPTQTALRSIGGLVACPECGGTKIIYKGEKTTAASAA